MGLVSALRTLHIRRAPPPDLRPRLPRELIGWIGDGRRPFAEYAVASLVPDVFGRYARIFHPAWSAEGLPVRWESVAAWSGRSMHRLAQWDFLSVPVAASSREAPFAEAPDVGRLPKTVASTIVEVLVRHKRTPDDGFIGVWEGHAEPDAEAMGPDVLDLDQRTFLVRHAPMSNAVEIGWRGFGGFGSGSPTLLWPADRAWFVAGDVDLDSTYVGGTSDLIDDLLARSDLEAREVFPHDGVSLLSDEINAPRGRPGL